MTKRALHNALFVAIVTNNRTLVIELLTFLLPHEQLVKLDLRTVKFEATVFTDSAGDERRADAVISAMTRDGQRVIFLVEHKSSQDKGFFGQLLTYQALLETHLAAKVIAIIISNSKGHWRLPKRFRSKFAGNADAVGDDVALDFGYKLLHLYDYSQEDIIEMFPKSHPYMLALHCIRDLTHAKVANFFRSSLMLELDERMWLLGRATDCFTKYNSDFSWAVLEEIEVEAIDRPKDRIMERIKLGQEGWIEEGLIKGRQEGKQEGLQEGRQEMCEEIALQMLKDGMDVETICRITKLGRSTVDKLERNRARKKQRA